MYGIHQKVTVTKGHYKGRPAIIIELNRDGTYAVTLTDTPELNDVVIRSVKHNELKAR